MTVARFYIINEMMPFKKKYNEQNLSDILILWVTSFKKLCFSQVSECSSLCQRKLNVHSN